MTTAELVNRYATAIVALGIAEKRLAKVPALVEALKAIRDNTRTMYDGRPYNGEDDEIAAKALAEWERE